METIKISMIDKSGGTEKIRRAQRIFRSVKILYDIIVIDTCHYTFV